MKFKHDYRETRGWNSRFGPVDRIYLMKTGIFINIGSVQVMAWCHQEPSHYPNQYWVIDLSSIQKILKNTSWCTFRNSANHQNEEANRDSVRITYKPRLPSMMVVRSYPVYTPCLKQQRTKAGPPTLQIPWCDNVYPTQHVPRLQLPEAANQFLS